MAYSIDCHEWSLSWHPRGLMLTHKGHRFVLGVPANFINASKAMRPTPNSR